MKSPVGRLNSLHWRGYFKNEFIVGFKDAQLVHLYAESGFIDEIRYVGYATITTWRKGEKLERGAFIPMLNAARAACDAKRARLTTKWDRFRAEMSGANGGLDAAHGFKVVPGA